LKSKANQMGIKKNISLCLVFLFCLTPFVARPQFVIKSGAKLSASYGLIGIQSNIANQSDINLSKCDLVLTGTNQQLSTTLPITTHDLIIKGGGKKKLLGIWKVGHFIDLQNGFVIPDNSNAGHTGKIIFLGTEQPVGNTNSFVMGTFFSYGKGSRIFPIGNQAGFFPSALEDVTEPAIQIGIEVIEEDAKMQLKTTDGADYVFLTSRYWRVESDNGNFPNSKIGLSYNQTTPPFQSSNDLLVMTSLLPGGLVANLEQSRTDNQFTFSNTSIQSRDAIYTLATRPEIQLLIHNLLTPDTNQGDNQLVIENIQYYPTNKVILIDQWGGIVHEWKNFENNDTSFSYKSLSPGNYACVVEYSTPNGNHRVSQMVTVLK
jgi:hypothetical protein